MTPTQTLKHEAQIDSQIAEINSLIAAQEREFGYAQSRLTSALHLKPFQKLSYSQVEKLAREALADEATPSYTVNAINEQFKAVSNIRQEVSRLIAKAEPLHAEYRAQRWSRFFLVQNANGHIHSSMECATCYHDTSFAWCYELSGQTEAEAVEAYGEILCSVCYPSAPVAWTNGVSKASKAEKEERAAAKRERDAVKAAKAITNPDGSTIREPGQWGGEIKTLVSARRALMEQFKNREYYGDPNQERYEFAVVLAKAINHKTGEDIEELLIQAEYKAQKSVAKERAQYA